MRRRRILAILTITVSLFLALGLVELLLHIFWTPPALRTTHSTDTHAYYGWAPLPGLEGTRATSEYEHKFRHTSQRFRGNKAFTRERPAGIERRVLFLGDSFTYGVGSEDEEIFPALIDQAWPNVEVANGGCNGYGTRNSLAVLDQFGAAFRPELTVLVFFWNDLEDNSRPNDPQFEFDKAGRVVRAGALPKDEFDPLAELPTADAVYSSGWTHFYLRDLVRSAIVGFRLRVWGIKARSIQTAEELEEAWRITDQQLALIAARAKEIGTTLVVAPLPDHNQVNPDAFIKNIDPINFEIQERLTAICVRLGVRCVDLRSAMHESWKASGENYYYYADRHLTPTGNREFARLLQAELEPMLFEKKQQAPAASGG
jgi:lysophospholipase L1-like esterase